MKHVWDTTFIKKQCFPIWEDTTLLCSTLGQSIWDTTLVYQSLSESWMKHMRYVFVLLYSSLESLGRSLLDIILDHCMHSDGQTAVHCFQYYVTLYSGWGTAVYM